MPLSVKLAVALPFATGPEAAEPSAVSPCLTVKVTVPSLTMAVEGLLAVTWAVSVTLA